MVRDEFIDLELRHHQHSAEELAEHPAISADVLAAYLDLCKAAEDADSEMPSSRLWKRLARDFEQEAGAWRLIDHSRRAAKTSERSAAQLTKELDAARRAHAQELEQAQVTATRLENEAIRMTSALEAAEGCLRSQTAAFDTAVERERSLEEMLSNRSEELAELTAANEKLAARLEEHEALVDAKMQAELDRHEALAAQLLAERDDARARLAQHTADEPDRRAIEQERARLEAITAQLIAERDDAQGRLTQLSENAVADAERAEQLQSDLDEVHASTSWQVSKPVRIVGEVLKRRRRRN